MTFLEHGSQPRHDPHFHESCVIKLEIYVLSFYRSITILDRYKKTFWDELKTFWTGPKKVLERAKNVLDRAKKVLNMSKI